MFIEILCALIITATLSWYFYYLHCFTYWKKKGVPTPPPKFPTGNILKAVFCQEHLFTTVEKCYNEFKKKGYRHAGLYFFNGPVYVPIDPEIIKSILTTDFDHFVDRGVFIDEDKLPLSANLFSIDGSRWKNRRQKLSPAFSSGKLKSMYEIFIKTAENFISAIEPEAKKNGEINIKYLSTNYTSDIILATAFGLESNNVKNPDNKIAEIAVHLLNPPAWPFFKAISGVGLKNPGNIVIGNVCRESYITTFNEIVRNIIAHRDHNHITRKDILSFLLEIRDKHGLNFDEISGECFLFFLAGMETSSQTIAFCIHELAHNQTFQDKLRDEIFKNLGDDFTNYSYEDIMRLPYLDKVFNETLRLHPVLGYLNRICVKDYQVPGTNTIIEKGTPVVISLLGLELDPEYFPDPYKFDPERFDERESIVPFTFLPFGDGPRLCLGMRYGKLQTKLGIAALISKYKFFPSSNTPKYVELDKFSKSLAMIPGKGITVKVAEL